MGQKLSLSGTGSDATHVIQTFSSLAFPAEAVESIDIDIEIDAPLHDIEIASRSALAGEMAPADTPDGTTDPTDESVDDADEAAATGDETEATAGISDDVATGLSRLFESVDEGDSGTASKHPPAAIEPDGGIGATVQPPSSEPAVEAQSAQEPSPEPLESDVEEQLAAEVEAEPEPKTEPEPEIETETKTETDQYECDECGETFARSTDKARHINLEHRELDDEAGQYECDECGETFETSMAKARHAQWGHQADETEAAFVCDECGEMFEQHAQIANHVRWEHSEEADEEADEPAEDLPTLNPNTQRYGIVRALSDRSEPMTSREIAEESAGTSWEMAPNQSAAQLLDLKQKGLVEREKGEGGSYVYWLSDVGEKALEATAAKAA